MTREEAITQLQGWKYLFRNCMPEEKGEALDMAIEALQRTSNALPTHECVKATHECVEPVGISDNIEEMLQRFAQIMQNLEDMKILLSQRTGHWIENAEQNHVEVCYHCSECGFEAWGEHEKTRFCGGCGAWMTEEEVG